MSKPDDIPQDVWDAALDALNEWGELGWEGYEEPQLATARAILDERQRCLDICAAEREWCSGIEEVQLLIASGGPARVIPGWNAPSED